MFREFRVFLFAPCYLWWLSVLFIGFDLLVCRLGFCSVFFYLSIYFISLYCLFFNLSAWLSIIFNLYYLFLSSVYLFIYNYFCSFFFLFADSNQMFFGFFFTFVITFFFFPSTKYSSDNRLLFIDYIFFYFVPFIFLWLNESLITFLFNTYP